MSTSKVKQRTEKQIVTQWVEILYMLYLHGGQTTAQLQERLPLFEHILHDLETMQKKGLIFVMKQLHGRNVWLPTFLQTEANQPVQLAFTSQLRNPPAKKTLQDQVDKARPQERDIHDLPWIMAAKRVFAKSTECTGHRHICWDVANEKLAHFRRGNLKVIASKLRMGQGSCVSWSCGCKLEIPWTSGEGIWTYCTGICCERIVCLAIHQNQKARTFAATATSTQQVLVPSSTRPLFASECLIVIPPLGEAPVGKVIKHLCGCYFVRTEVHGDKIVTFNDVIAADRGFVVCEEHKEQIAVSND